MVCFSSCIPGYAPVSHADNWPLEIAMPKFSSRSAIFGSVILQAPSYCTNERTAGTGSSFEPRIRRKGCPIQSEHFFPVEANPLRFAAPGALFRLRPLFFRRLRLRSRSIFGLARFAVPAFSSFQLFPQVQVLGLRLAQLRRQRLGQVQQQPDTLAGTLILYACQIDNQTKQSKMFQPCGWLSAPLPFCLRRAGNY